MYDIQTYPAIIMIDQAKVHTNHSHQTSNYLAILLSTIIPRLSNTTALYTVTLKPTASLIACNLTIMFCNRPCWNTPTQTNNRHTYEIYFLTTQTLREAIGLKQT